MDMNEAQFKSILSDYGDTVYRVALHILCSVPDSEDVVQQTFTKLWTSDKHYDSEEHLRRWLIRVAVNECRKELRSTRRRIAPLDDTATEPEFVNDEYREVWEKVKALDPKYRTAVYLRYYEGYTAEEIAKMTGLTASTVRTRLMRAREQLKNLLGGDEYE